MRKLTIFLFSVFFFWVSQAFALRYSTNTEICPPVGSNATVSVFMTGPTDGYQHEFYVDIEIPPNLEYVSGSFQNVHASIEWIAYTTVEDGITYLHIRGFSQAGYRLDSAQETIATFKVKVNQIVSGGFLLGPLTSDLLFTPGGVYDPAICEDPNDDSTCYLACPVPEPFDLNTFQLGCFQQRPCIDHGFFWAEDKGRCYLTGCDYKLEYCTDQTSCEEHGGYFIDDECVPTAACDSSTLTLCPDDRSCIYFGGYWYSNSCHTTPCDIYNPSYCKTEEECSQYAFGYWYQDPDGQYACHPLSDACANGQFENCLTESACSLAGGYWYNDKCNATYCDMSDLSRCDSELHCLEAGGTWEWIKQADGSYQGVCTACSSTNLSACLTPEGCQKPGIGGYWYAGSCHTGSCGSDQECCLAYGGYWDADRCWECRSDALELCQNEASCVHFGGLWDSNSSTCSYATCGPTSLPACTDETSCENSGGYWYDNKCNDVPICTHDVYKYCSESDCIRVDRIWYEGKCLECSPEQLDLCTSQETCSEADGVWKDDQCVPKSCKVGYLDLCENQEDCEDAGGIWYGDKCYQENPCTPDTLDECLNEDDCIDLGLGYWYDDSCHQDPCDPENLEACKTQQQCVDYGHGTWTNNRCVRITVKTCSYEEIWRCVVKEDCEAVGGIWSNFRCLKPENGEPNVPTGECEVGNPEGCDTEVACILAGGIWDGHSCLRPGSGTSSLSPIVSIIIPLSDYNPYLNLYPVQVGSTLTLTPILKVLPQDVGKIADLYAALVFEGKLYFFDNTGTLLEYKGGIPPAYKTSVTLPEQIQFNLFAGLDLGTAFFNTAADVYIGYASGGISNLKAGGFRLLFTSF